MTDRARELVERACAVPLHELLRRVPRDMRLEIEHGPTHHEFIPIGRLAHEAADFIEQSLTPPDTLSGKVVEKVARAIEQAFPECIDEGRMGFILRLARAALSAIDSENERLREALVDASATLAAVRATSVGSEWAACAEHFHGICGDTLRCIRAALSPPPAEGEK